MERTNVTADGPEASILKLKETVVFLTGSVSGTDFRSPHLSARNVE
jgi:hypothetical protein